MSDLLAFGAATIDIQARAIGPVLAGTSNPVRQMDSAGGVARNIAASFALLGGTVRLVSRIGSDAHGTRLVDDLISHGVDVTGVTRSDIHPTASYTALLEPDGGLFAGFSDMAVIDELNADNIDSVVDRHGPAGIWFADANLPVETLVHLAIFKPQGVRLAVDGTSVAKVLR
ncbi:MAG: PfkB family carbohydrate kinase, partial [Alphaproteobacteria bacterium]